MNIHHSLHAKRNWDMSNSFNINVIYLQIVLWYFLQSSFLFSDRSIFSSDALRFSSTSISAGPLLPFVRSKSSGNSTDGKENKNRGLYSNVGSFFLCNYIFVSRMGLRGNHARAARRTPNNFLIRAIFSSHRMQTAVLTPSGCFCVTLRHASYPAYTVCRQPPFCDALFSFLYQTSRCDSYFGDIGFKSLSDYWLSLLKLFVVLPSLTRK